MKFLNYLLVITILFFSGCSEKDKFETPLLPEDIVYEKPPVDYTQFEASMVTASNKAERHWKEYTELLMSRKEMRNKDLENHIPYGMGKRVSLNYHGKLGELVKLLGAKADYTVEFDGMKVTDTPLVTVEYNLTSIYDILRNMIDKYELDIKIKETDKIIVLSIKV